MDFRAILKLKNTHHTVAPPCSTFARIFCVVSSTAMLISYILQDLQSMAATCYIIILE